MIGMNRFRPVFASCWGLGEWKIFCPCNLFAGLLSLYIGIFLIILLVSFPSKKREKVFFCGRWSSWSANKFVSRFCKPCFDGIHYRIYDSEYGRLSMRIHIGEHWETDVEVWVFHHFMSPFTSLLLWGWLKSEAGANSNLGYSAITLMFISNKFKIITWVFCYWAPNTFHTSH